MTRLRDERGQALLMVIVIALLIAVAGAFLFAYGQALGSRGRYQRVADLSAMSAARVMSHFVPAFVRTARAPGWPSEPGLHEQASVPRACARCGRLRGGSQRPPAATWRRLVSGCPVVRADAGARSHRATRSLEAPVVRWPPLCELRCRGEGDRCYRCGSERWRAHSLRGSVLRAARAPTGQADAPRHGGCLRPSRRCGAGRRRRAVGHQRVPLRRRAGALVRGSPRPEMGRPAGKSLHRNGTELDLGPPSAYAWLARNASRFGFVKRYSWEPWHFGLASGATVTGATGDGDSATIAPAFVPERWRVPLTKAATRWNVPVELLAAQLYTESNFNPFAVSPAGARGLAQFTPGTARADGLTDPVDRAAADDAPADPLH